MIYVGISLLPLMVWLFVQAEDWVTKVMCVGVSGIIVFALLEMLLTAGV